MIKINLAPPELARRRRGMGLSLPKPNLGMLFAVLYVLLLAGLGWWWWDLTGQKTRLTGDVARAEQELAALKATVAQGATVKNDVADLRRRVELVETLTRDQGRPIRLFDSFADMIPRDLWVTAMEEKTSVLKISGAAFSPTAVSDFMTNLRRSGRFKDVDVVVSRQDPAKTPRTVTFEITCRFEG